MKYVSKYLLFNFAIFSCKYDINGHQANTIFKANYFNYIFFSAREDASRETLKMSESFYYKGNCNNQAVKDDLKRRYHHYLQTQGPMVSCIIYGLQCIPANMHIYCGAKDLM